MMTDTVTAADVCTVLGYPADALKGTAYENATFTREGLETALARQTPLPERRRSWVYFVRRSDGLVKIGRSTNPERRLKDLRSAGGPMELVAWFDGDAGTERALHDAFAAHHVSGEWFAPSKFLTELIATKCRANEANDTSTATEQSLTTAEACQRLRISRTTLWRLVQAGKLHPVRITATKTLYSSSEVDRLANADPGDDLATIRAAYAFLAERHAEERRPICPSCGKRRVNQGASLCTWCVEQHELQLHHKRVWWDKHGQDNRLQRRHADAS